MSSHSEMVVAAHSRRLRTSLVISLEVASQEEVDQDQVVGAVQEGDEHCRVDYI